MADTYAAEVVQRSKMGVTSVCSVFGLYSNPIFLGNDLSAIGMYIFSVVKTITP